MSNILAATTKILKQGDQKPSELEAQIAQNLLDLEASSDLKMQLRELYITGAREIDIAGGKKAVILFVPVPQLAKFQKVQSKLVKELEKKFNGKHFVVIAQVKTQPPFKIALICDSKITRLI
jgi:small subunit ribosomal protein S7e